MGIVMQTVATVPAEAWVGLLGVIFGSLLTTFGVWLTNKSNARNIRAQLEHDEKLHRQRATKERLEELYILVCHWNSGMIKNFLNLRRVMVGHTDYNQYLDSVISLRPGEGIDLYRLEMILSVYGTNLRAAYDDAVRVRERIKGSSPI